MKHHLFQLAGILSLILLVSLLVIPQGVNAAPVAPSLLPVNVKFQQTSDQAALESVVTFSGNNAQGAGYIAGETVHIDVRGPNAEVFACDAIVDSSGAWSCSVNLWKDSPITGTFYYKATGLKSGVSYTGSFNNVGAVKSVKLVVDGKELADKAVIYPGTVVDAKIELESTARNFSWSATKYQIQQKSCANAENCTWKTVYSSPCLAAPEPDLKGVLPHLYVTLLNVFKQTQVNSFYQLMMTTYADTACKTVNGEQWYYADEFELRNYETKTDLVCTPTENSFGAQFDCNVTVARVAGKSESPMGVVSFEVEKPATGMNVPAACYLTINKDGTSTCSTTFRFNQNGKFNLRANFASNNSTDDPSTSTWQNITFEIQTPVITITADALTKTYGDSDPIFTYTASPKTLYGVISGSLVRTAGEEVGTYTISQGSLKAAEGYTLKFIPSQMTIEKAKAKILASGFSGAYDGQPHGATGTAVGVKGEDLSQLLTPGKTFVNAPGGNSTLSFAGNTNYLAESIQNIPVIITARELEISADVLSKTYGDADPNFSYRITGGNLIGTDKITGAITRDAGENAGMHVLEQGSLSGGQNYHITFISAWFKINKRPITITADPQSKQIGSPEPPLTYKITDGQLINGDMFSGAPARTPGETVGSYPIAQGSLYLTENYEITFLGSTFTIYDPAEGLDADSDGIINAADNCVFKSNQDQKDTDNDGFGDICDSTPLNLMANMIVPVTGSSNKYEITCDGSTTLSLPDGSFVTLPKELCDLRVVVGSESEASLPAKIPSFAQYISAINLALLDSQSPVELVTGQSNLKYSFRIPSTASNITPGILYWDETSKAGQGNWVELPQCPIIRATNINKNSSSDNRQILTCSLAADHKIVTFTTNFSGLFVLYYRQIR